MKIPSNNESDKFFDPQVTQTGWHKDMPSLKRRSMMLQAHGGDRLATARALGELANVTQDKETRKVAKTDSEYFYREYHREQQSQMRREPSYYRRAMPRITNAMPRLR